MTRIKMTRESPISIIEDYSQEHPGLSGVYAHETWDASPTQYGRNATLTIEDCSVQKTSRKTLHSTPCIYIIYKGWSISPKRYGRNATPTIEDCSVQKPSRKTLHSTPCIYIIYKGWTISPKQYGWNATLTIEDCDVQKPSTKTLHFAPCIYRDRTVSALKLECL